VRKWGRRVVSSHRSARYRLIRNGIRRTAAATLGFCGILAGCHGATQGSPGLVPSDTRTTTNSSQPGEQTSLSSTTQQPFRTPVQVEVNPTLPTQNGLLAPPGGLEHAARSIPLSPLSKVIVPTTGRLPFRVSLRLPPICRYEAPDDLAPGFPGTNDLGDIAVSANSGREWLPTGWITTRRAKPGERLDSILSDIDQEFRIEDLRHALAPGGAQEWRVRLDSRAHASGGEHWVLAVKPSQSDLFYRLDWDNTHMYAFPGQRNPLFEAIANEFRVGNKG